MKPMPRVAFILSILPAFFGVSCKNQPQNPQQLPLGSDGKQALSAAFGTPVLDGSAADDAWEAAAWLNLDQVWAGQPPAATDCSGRYKLAWDENNLYILAEITDDSLMDLYPQDLEHYWDDDCLIVCIDEDASGGGNQYDYSAFTYHIALDGRVTDLTSDSTYRNFDDHCLTRRITRGHVSTWEIAVRIFEGKQFLENGEHTPKLLKPGKKMGFALAYNDNDASPERENLVGNVSIRAQINNRKRPDAGIFGLLTLQ